MDRQDAYDLYNNVKKIDLSDLLKIIVETSDEEERNFYVKIYNYVMQSQQKVLVANGIY